MHIFFRGQEHVTNVDLKETPQPHSVIFFLEPTAPAPLVVVGVETEQIRKLTSLEWRKHFVMFFVFVYFQFLSIVL